MDKKQIQGALFEQTPEEQVEMRRTIDLQVRLQALTEELLAGFKKVFERDPQIGELQRSDIEGFAAVLLDMEPRARLTVAQLVLVGVPREIMEAYKREQEEQMKAVFGDGTPPKRIITQ